MATNPITGASTSSPSFVNTTQPSWLNPPTSFAPVIAHANNPSVGPTSGVGKTTSRTAAQTRTTTAVPVWAKGLPGELASAIGSAAKSYGVDPAVLTGIWRRESGSTFPNPYKNSLGYGGLFGTKMWNAPTQQQANFAASTLANLIKSHGGSLAKALLAYSGNSYSSVYGTRDAYYSGVNNINPNTTLYSMQTGDGGAGGGGGGETKFTPASTNPSDYGFETASSGGNNGSWIPGKQYFVNPDYPKINTNDPNLPIMQKAWLSALQALQNPGGYLKASGQIASALISPQIQQALAAGQLGANNIVQFNRGQQQLLSQVPGQIGDIYNQGIGIENQLAQGVAQSLGAANPNAADQAALQAIGAPPEQQAQVAAQNQSAYGMGPSGGGAALQALGTIPALTLNQAKSNAMAYAQTLPALSKIQAGQALSSYESNQIAAIAKIAAQQPALAAKLFGTMSASGGKALSALGGAIKQSQDVSLKKGQLGLDQWKAENTVVYQNGKLYQGGQKLSIDATKAFNQAKYWVGQLSNAADRNSLYDRRTTAMLVHNAAELSLQRQKALGFMLIPDGKGGYTVQATADHRAKILPDGSVYVWKPKIGGAAGPGGVTPGEYATKQRNFQTWAGKVGSPTATKASGGRYRWVSTGLGTGKWVPNKNYVPGTQPGPKVSYQEALAHAISMGIKRQDAINMLSTTPGFEVGTNGNYWPTVQAAISNVTQFATQYLDQGHTANEIYQSALASGGFNPTMLAKIRYTINRLATHHYFLVHPNAKSLPGGILIVGGSKPPRGSVAAKQASGSK